METPKITLETTNGDLDLTYENTRLRTFADESLDHIERKYEDGTLRGLRVGRAVLDLLFENNYPMSYDPIPDEATINWFTSLEADGLDEELDSL